MGKKYLSWQMGYFIGGILVLILLPKILYIGFFLHIATVILIWAILCLSLNIIFGYTGQLSLAHGGLFGIGGYVYGILSTKLSLNFWLACPIAALAAGIAGVLIGVPSLRLRGPFFVIVTLGFNIIIVAIIKNLTKLTGGVNGLMGIPGPSSLFTPLINIDFETRFMKYYLILFFFLIVIVIAYRTKKCLVGKCFAAIKEDEDLCKSVGINTMSLKMQSFILSSILAGLAGVLYASYIGMMIPEDASFHIGFDALVYLTVGGIGTLLGSIVGPTLMIILSEIFQVVAEARTLFNGLALVLLIIFMPKGIIGNVLPLLKKRNM
jgi:branched-chain amino acid transport system permease protein